MRYEAVDGKKFDTEKECREYESNPTIWVVFKNTILGDIQVALKIFLTEEEAKSYVGQNVRFGQNVRYRIKVYVLSKFPHPEPEIDTVFDTSLLRLETEKKNEELDEKRKTAWEKLKSFLSS